MAGLENLGQGMKQQLLQRHVVVVGGGWAGCSAAVELTRQGDRVTLLEAARTLGGRARRVELAGSTLDNGQHILLGAYSETLRLMQVTGIDTKQGLLRLPLQMPYPPASGAMHFAAPNLPAPLHLLVALIRAKGLGVDDKMSLMRFNTSAKWMGWSLHQDCTVSELLDRFDQTDRLIRLLWRPLCIAALNTPPERASAQVMLNVLRDSLGASAKASHMLLPRVDLSELFPEQAARYVGERGGDIRRGTRAESLQGCATGWTVHCGEGVSFDADAVIIATAPWQAATLLRELQPNLIPAFAYEPITTCYLQYPDHTKLARPFFALEDIVSKREWGQFVFDRGQLAAKAAGSMAVVISASSDAIASGNEALATDVANQLARTLDDPAFATPLWSQVITEKRATFSCAPALQRPPVKTGLQGLLLAGDYTEGPYPATIESAVRSGVQAARSSRA